MFRTTLIAIVVILTGILFAPAPASAAADGTCSLMTTTGLIYSVTSGLTTQTGTVFVTCKNTSNSTFNFTTASVVTGTMQRVGGTDTLGFSIDKINASIIPNNGVATPFPFTGHITPNQQVRAGGYTATTPVTLNITW